MVLNLYSCARGRSCLWCAYSAFNHPSLDDISTGRGCVGVKREGRHACGGPSLSVLLCCGGVLLSHNLAVAVPLALPGLASRFGMEAGRFPGAMTTTSLVFNTVPVPLFCLVGGVG